jgi:predicted permease
MTRRSATPLATPWLARSIVGAIAPRADRRFLLQDLEEEFARISEEQGPSAARSWYWQQVRRSIAPLARERFGRAIRRAHERPAPAARALLADLTQSMRWLRRHPATVAIVVATLAIAFGTVLGTFTVIDSILLKPLPFTSPDRIVNVWATGPAIPRAVRSSSRPNFEDWRERARSFKALSAYSPLEYRLTGRGEPREVDGVRVAPDFDLVLGIQPFLGRVFQRADYSEGSAPVVVLTHAFWQSEFAGSASVLQHSLDLDGRQYQIVGVLPKLDASFPLDRHEFWVPLIPRQGAFWEHSRGTGWLAVVGRVRDDHSLETARAELSTVVRALAEQYPDVNRGRTDAVLVPIASEITGPLAPMLRLLGAALLAVLLVALGNIGNLLLVSMARRRREFAVRSAIGAGGARLSRQVLGETVMMCAMAAAGAVALSPVLVRGFVSVYPGRLSRDVQSGVDATTILTAAILGLAAAVLLGVPQALHARRVSVGPASSSRTIGRRGDRALRGVLVGAQVALSFVLIVSGVAFVRTLDRLHRVDTGYRADGVVTFTVAPSPAQSTGTAALQFYEAVVTSIREIPGVRAAAAGVAAPMTTGGWRFGIRPPGATADVLVGVNLTTPDYFEALGIQLLDGRLLSEDEQRQGRASAVVSEPLARLLGGNVVGRYFDYSDVKWQIVGVVEGVRHTEPRNEPLPELIIPWHLAGRRPQTIVVRAHGDPLALLPEIATRIHAIDPTAPLADIARLEDRLRDAVAPERFRATLLAVLAAIAVGLAALGAYTVTAYAVAQRTREYGIRLALGERPVSIGRRALNSALVPSLIGVMAGCAIALATSRWTESFLYQVKAADHIALAGAAGTLILLSIVAGAASARRAAGIDPSRTLIPE